MLEVGVGGHGHLSLEGTGSSIAQPEGAARKTAPLARRPLTEKSLRPSSGRHISEDCLALLDRKTRRWRK